VSPVAIPTRDFTLILDPFCLEDLLHYPLVGSVALIADLMGLNPPVNVHLIFPDYLATDVQRDLAETGCAPLAPAPQEEGIPCARLSSDIRRKHRERIERGAEGDCRGLRLLALADHLKADGVVTAIPSLLEARYALLRHQKFLILLPEELPDFVEVCARGHGLSCSATLAPMWIAPDVLYQFVHWKARRLAEWFNRMSPTLSDGSLRELLRSAILNRYPFILYARDMVRFHRLQAHYHLRRGANPQVFRAPLNYHLTAFYVHVWGMLDSLAQVANIRLGLSVNPFRCHIDRDDFLQPLNEKCAGLRRFIKEHGREWVGVIGDVRHPGAHSALRLQHDVVAATDESKKSDDEISAILRREDPDFYEMFPPPIAKALEPIQIANWRLSKMKVVTDDAIYVEQAGKSYVRAPVASIDFDLERLNAFIDAFLVACFKRRP